MSERLGNTQSPGPTASSSDSQGEGGARTVPF